LQAIEILKHKNVILFIVGVNDDEYGISFKRRVDSSGLKHLVHLLPDQPFENLPEILSFVDLVVVPQRQRPASFGQFPARIFDAMAMDKPIVATEA
jgi:glycosyltransferase involved in cell wall biosynthesis